MELIRTQENPAQDWLIGYMDIDGRRLYTVERLSLAFPGGIYPVRLTVSGRVQAGKLWSPRPPLLPLIEVPGREGIRFHSGNSVRDVVGCVAVGWHQGQPGWVRESRRALQYLMARLSPGQDYRVEVRYGSV